MDTRIVAAGFVAAAVGIFFLHRWMLRRANAQYAREVAALHDRIRAKAAAREQAEREKAEDWAARRMAADAENRQKFGAAIPVGDPRHPARRRAEGFVVRGSTFHNTEPAPARRPVSAYDARKAEVRHQHESAVFHPEPDWRPRTVYGVPIPDAPTVSGSGGTFDGGGASGDWSSSPSDSGSSSSDSGSSSSGSD